MSIEISDLKNNAMDLIHLDGLMSIPLVRGEKGDKGDKGDDGETYDDSEIRGIIANKVDRITGKGLSTNDFTDDLKQKLEDIEEGSFLPSGGITGQVLAKASEQDGDVEWVEQSGGASIIIKRWGGA